MIEEDLLPEQRLAIAVLQGDLEAALILADKVQEDRMAYLGL